LTISISNTGSFTLFHSIHLRKCPRSAASHHLVVLFHYVFSYTDALARVHVVSVHARSAVEAGVAGTLVYVHLAGRPSETRLTLALWQVVDDSAETILTTVNVQTKSRGIVCAHVAIRRSIHQGCLSAGALQTIGLTLGVLVPSHGARATGFVPVK